MQFELTESLIDGILFAMEDQEGEFYVDSLKGIVAGGLDWPDCFDEEPDDDGEGGERFISLPEWNSADGFRLMERFSAMLRNPMVREELSSALGMGRGVFRAFKNVLGRHPEAEKLWFSFKEKEMKREVLRWYNALREEWGLEKIGNEPEDTGDLLGEDFRFHPFQEDSILHAEALHRQCLEESANNLTDNVAGHLAEIITREAQAFRSFPGPSLGIYAESLGGDFAGYISGIVKDSALYIQSLEVKPEFRGLGVGESLLTRFLENQDPNQVNQVFFDLPSWAEGFSRVLLREAFKPFAVRYWLNLKMRDS